MSSEARLRWLQGSRSTRRCAVMSGLLTALLISAASLQAQTGASDLAPEIVQAGELRRRLGVVDPPSMHRIYVHSQSAHHLIVEYTRIAGRGPDGRWTVVSIGEERPGLVGTEIRTIPEERRNLTAAEADRLDRLLRSDAVYRQTSPQEDDVPIGEYFHVMEIVTPERRTVIRWTDRLRGPAGRVADLIMGRPG